MNKDNNILVVAPHQDDEVIGCGGTMAFLKKSGYDIFVVQVFKGSSGVEGKNCKDSAFIRHKEALRASKILGFNLLDNLGFIDRHEDDITKIQNSLISVIRKVKPCIIFAPHHGEHDFEHQLVSRACWEASWLASTENFPELGKKVSKTKVVLEYEIWTPIEQPDFYLDITKYISLKRESLMRYKSQIKKVSWLEGICGLNSYRGAVLQKNGFAEAFRIKSVNLSEFVSAFNKLGK